jgi:predicted nucleic acid-binding protein
MPEGITVSNSSCLIALDAVGRLEILRQLYSTVVVPSAVESECGGQLPPWFQIQPVQNRLAVQSLQLELGDGEAEAIALCSERSATRLILDDRKARRIASQLQLPVTGTLAILVRAKEQGFIPTVREVIKDLLAVNFRVSEPLVRETLHRAGE